MIMRTISRYIILGDRNSYQKKMTMTFEITFCFLKNDSCGPKYRLEYFPSLHNARYVFFNRVADKGNGHVGRKVYS